MKQSLTGKQRKHLRGLAHGLKPVVQVGVKGLTEELIAAINEALDAHELIKIKFMEFKEEKHEIADQIASKVSCELAGMIGNIAILYRRHKDKSKRHVDPGPAHGDTED